MRMIGAVYVALALGASSSTLLAGEPVPCANGMFIVDDQIPELHAQLCDLAPRIRDELAGCGLVQTRPLLLQIVEEPAHSIGNCLAWYDCDNGTISLINPARYRQVLDSESPYSQLPPKVLLENALTHELVHALIHQSAGEREIALVHQEYIAAALELELMEPKWRDVLIGAAPVSLPPKPGLIDIWIYGLEPRKFATNAWQHFSMSGNGCGLVNRIVQGEETLSGQAR